jgi:peptidoglycan hydrolase FlgJ
MADASFALQAEAALMAGRQAPQINRPSDVQRAHQVAQDFEAFFLAQMLQPMFAGLESEEPFGGGAAEGVWRSLQVDEYGKAMARAGGIGIADAVLAEILKMQEGQ